MELKDYIRSIQDYPKEGILFRDITTLLKDKDAFKLAIDKMAEQVKDKKVDLIVGAESRGFLIGSALAYKMNCGFIPVRKPNKLPAETIKEDYDLEYGSNTIEIHADSFEKGANVLVVDDLLATGGTAKAACNLVRKAGGNLVGAAFLIELCDLKGIDKLNDCGKIVSMLKY